MTKPKIFTFAFALGTAFLSAFLFFGTAAVAPEEACAGNCNFDWWNAEGWGQGWYCAPAETACYNDAYAAAQAVCAAENKSVCQVGTFTVHSCYWVGTQKQVDCDLDYKCDRGPDIPF